MHATPRSMRIALVAIVCCQFVVALAVEQEAGKPQAGAGFAPQNPETMGMGSFQPRVRIVHPQISQSTLAREYRWLPSPRPQEARIREALDQELEGEWQFSETPLIEVVAQVRDGLKVPVASDVRSFEEAGIDFETPITFHANAGSVRSALRRLLNDLDLSWTISDECLLITTKERAEELLTTRLYPLPFGYAADSAQVDYQSLIDLIQNTCTLTCWDSVGGAGSIRVAADAQAIAVSQTEEIHEEVEGLLRALHAKALEKFGVAGDGANPRAPVVKIHAVADGKVRADLAAKLAELCNGSLPQGADPQARVTAVGECLAVQSVSPEFHILAGQLIRGVAGVETVESNNPFPGGGGGMGGGMGMGGMGGE